MQIIIPMSGFGERFRAAGYNVPKPLIEVNGKCIIQYIVEMFPGLEYYLNYFFESMRNVFEIWKSLITNY